MMGDGVSRLDRACPSYLSSLALSGPYASLEVFILISHAVI